MWRVSCKTRLVVVLMLVAGLSACTPTAPVTDSASHSAASIADKAFQITWPLEDPLKPRRHKVRTLLEGQLRVVTVDRASSQPHMTVRITLSRPQDDEFRQYWNEHLMYRQFGWMEQVRVWDKDHKWLYPNLAYLFKLHGVDRVGRYGGWDPGKRVDNDFGAVLIRLYEADGKQECSETRSTPLVSAAWHSDDARGASRYAIVHRVRSDDFTIELPANTQQTWLRAKVWLIYGDFFGQPRPHAWPVESGEVGGALAFFTIDWVYQVGKQQRPVVQQQRPEPTRFDWTAWIDRAEQSDEPVGTPRLTVALGATEKPVGADAKPSGDGL